jgi:hypothetical protein
VLYELVAWREEVDRVDYEVTRLEELFDDDILDTISRSKAGAAQCDYED